MPTLDGIMGGRRDSSGVNNDDSSSTNNSRPSLSSIRQASTQALSKAQLMVGLKSASDLEEGSTGGQSSSQTSRGGVGGGAGNNSENAERSSSFIDEAADLICPDLTFQQRLIGFASCFTVGYLITFMSFKFFIELIEGYPVPFAVNYTVGNILALGASWFLCGPRRQFRNMFDQNRKFTSIVYLSCLGGTLAVVFVPLPWAIRLFTLILLLATQFCASFWYSLSYVPYGRRTVTRMLKRAVGMNDSSPSEGWVSLSGLTGRGGGGSGSEGN
mmetsp:Transcript_39260/g.94926  ORF Transcript_39260/g.94926 Transcript_39260/m.94926 type:complete len:272 (+) Transcript_39260:197-1012(+)